MATAPEASRTVQLRLGDGLWQALQERCSRSGESPDHVIGAALAEALDVDHHTIYQVSTSSALVKGVYQGCVRVADLLRHGDFGLGTFDGLDGEGILLDGACWQARADGSVHGAPPEALAPFWVVTRFSPTRGSSCRTSAAGRIYSSGSISTAPVTTCSPASPQ
ncbi:MAG: acetolactate decarboxylase [Cyanobium sp. CZS 25K]|nr:acetolactate decarboxylase [Cyanobium sp. CZS25K]